MKKLNIFILVLVFLMSGCEQDSALIQRFDESDLSGKVGLKVIQLSPEATRINFYVDGKKFSASLSPVDTVIGLDFGTLYPVPSLSYGYVPQSQSYKFDVYNLKTLITSKNVSTDGSTNYTAFIADSLSKLDVVFVSNDVKDANPNVAYVRIGNFIPRSEVDVRLTRVLPDTATRTSKDTLWFRNVGFKQVVNFDTLTRSNYKAVMFNSATKAAYDSIASIAGIPGSAYTLYTRGLTTLSGTNTKRPLIYQHRHK